MEELKKLTMVSHWMIKCHNEKSLGKIIDSVQESSSNKRSDFDDKRSIEKNIQYTYNK